ncbi:MAG: DUF2339 domain-containing protein [Acidobacteriota bacterium]
MDAEPGIVILIGLTGAVVIGAPLLSLVTWFRVRRLERQRRPPSDQQLFAGDLSALTQRIQLLEDRFKEFARPSQADSMVSLPAPEAALPPPPLPARPSSPVMTPVAAGSREPSPIFTESLPDQPAIDLESEIAGHWMNRLGLLAVAIGVSYFLKLAIDNDWIGPSGQVAIGLLIGADLIALGPVFLRKDLVYFADGITGLGAAVLYLSLWAAGSYYGLLSQNVVFVAMIIVTAAILAIAVGRNSQRVAVIAMIGGFMTPALVSTGRDTQVVLFSYLALHNGALLVLAGARDWRFLEVPALAFTQVYFWNWFDRFYAPARMASTVAFASLFFGQFAAVPVIRSRRAGSLHSEQALLLVVNAGLILLALHQTLWPDHKWPLTFATLVLAAVHLALARVVPGSASVAQLILAGLALSFVTIAVPIRLSTRWITMAWAIEAAVIMWTGLRTRLCYLRTAAFVLFGLVAIRLLHDPLPAQEFLFNVRFATYLVVASAIGISLWLARDAVETLSDFERTGLGGLAVGINLLLVVALTSEVMLFYRPGPGGWSNDDRLAEGLTISLLWAVYASVLVFAGVKWSSESLRWQGLILLGLTTFKVFLIDLSVLSGFYRVISSIALGVVLIVISYVYQRRQSVRAEAG